MARAVGVGVRRIDGPVGSANQRTEPAESAVLGDPHGAGGGADRLGRLLRAEPDRDPQNQYLALSRGEQLQQPAQPLAEFRGQQALLGTVLHNRALGQLSHRIGAVAADGAEGVGDLVCGDGVDERQTTGP